MAQKRLSSEYRLLIIGGSAGSLDALIHILSRLNAPLGISILVVMHRKNAYESGMATLLQTKARWPVQEAEDKMPLLTDHIYLAPPDYHLLIEENLSCALDVSEKVNFSRPSIDLTFESGAAALGARLICMLLSGANNDGAKGMAAAAAAGAAIIIQDPRDATVGIMPEAAIRSTSTATIAPAKQLYDKVAALLQAGE